MKIQNLKVTHTTVIPGPKPLVTLTLVLSPLGLFHLSKEKKNEDEQLQHEDKIMDPLAAPFQKPSIVQTKLEEILSQVGHERAFEMCVAFMLKVYLLVPGQERNL